VQVDITAVSDDFTFAITKIKNPYSQINAVNLDVKHYAGCGAIATKCSDDCNPGLVAQYSVPAIGSLPKPSSSLTT